MKTKLFSFLLWGLAIGMMSLAARLVHAGTCVPSGKVYDGNGGPWTLAGSPYYLNGTAIEIPDGQTLTIEAGVTVFIRTSSAGNGGYIEVRGRLVAVGKTEAYIFFSGMEPPARANSCAGVETQIPGVWKGLQFIDPDPGSLMSFCWVNSGSTNISVISSSASVPNKNLTIANCFVTNSKGDGISLNTGGSPNILNTTIRNNGGVGLREAANSCDPVVRGCAFMQNSQPSLPQSNKYPLVTFADNVKNYSNLYFTANAIDAIWVWAENISTGTWQDHGVPYHVVSSSGNPVIPDGNTLRLAPGTDVRFNAAGGFIVQGTLAANGDSCRFITFDNIDPTNAQRWSSLSLSNSDPGTILNYCDIRNGGFNAQASVLVSGGGNNVVISNSKITQSLGPGISIQSTSASAAPRLLNNLIGNNAQQGVRIASGVGSLPVLRYNLITQNNEGVRISAANGNVDLGAAADLGHNAFVNNAGFELYNQAATVISATGNYWADADSAIIDQKHIFDNDERAASGRVILNPVDLTDQSRPPQTVLCAPACVSLAIAITNPTIAPTFQTTSRLLTLGGTAADDRAVASITWKNVTTGTSGSAMLGPDLQNMNWRATNIALVVGQNLLLVTATDFDGCIVTDQLSVNLITATNCWENDTFDNLALGSLDGQNGWSTVPGRSPLNVIANPIGTGQVLQLDAPANQVAIVEKDVPDQTAGLQTLELLVLAQPSDTSMAKLEVKTTGNPNWDKKVQLYFGASMRLNYGPTPPEAIIFLSQTEPLRWYHVQTVIDLNTNRVDLFLDGVQVLNDVAVGSGPMTHLSLSAFDSPGYVLFDDIRGCQTQTTAVALASETRQMSDYRLHQNYPNPFNPETLIRYEIPRAGHVLVEVYNMVGQKVRTLVNSVQQIGHYQVNWDGRDERGQVAPSGMYFYRLHTGDFIQVRKMTLLR